MDLKATYIPSKNILEGELLIKGKTLGRWHPKRFIIDQDQRVFALKSSDPKKKYKVYLLANYMVVLLLDG